MRKEYNLTKMKEKRRGIHPDLADSTFEDAKIRITIALDKEVIDYFKEEANKPGALPYQTQINRALRSLLPGSSEHNLFYETLKKDLLHDKKFIHSLKTIFKKAS